MSVQTPPETATEPTVDRGNARRGREPHEVFSDTQGIFSRTGWGRTAVGTCRFRSIPGENLVYVGELVVQVGRAHDDLEAWIDLRKIFRRRGLTATKQEERPLRREGKVIFQARTRR